MKTKHTTSPWAQLEPTLATYLNTDNSYWVMMSTKGESFHLVFPPSFDKEEAQTISSLIELAPEMEHVVRTIFNAFNFEDIDKEEDKIILSFDREWLGGVREIAQRLPQTEIEDDRNEYYAEFRSANSEGGAKFKAYGMDEVITMLKRDHNNQVEILSIKLVE